MSIEKRCEYLPPIGKVKFKVQIQTENDSNVYWFNKALPSNIFEVYYESVDDVLNAVEKLFNDSLEYADGDVFVHSYLFTGKVCKYNVEAVENFDNNWLTK